MAKAVDEVLFYAERETPCQRLPERCRRREAAHVVLDADGVLWHITPPTIASSVCGPFKAIDENTVEGRLGTCWQERPGQPALWTEGTGRVKVTLLPGLRETIRALKMQGITLSVASLNQPGSVKAILEAFGLKGEFLAVKDTWQAKERSVREIAEGHHLAPCSMLFVDDTLSHVEGVSQLGVLSLHMGGDIQAIAQVLDYVK